MSPETRPEERGAPNGEDERASGPGQDDGAAEGGEPLDERTRIVRMVASGRLSADQAVDLLRTLEDGPRPGASGEIDPRGRWEHGGRPGAEAGSGPTWPPQRPHPTPLPRSMIGRALRFEVQDDDHRVTASLPLGLVGSEGRFLPRLVRQALEESEVDLDQIRDLIVNGGDQLDEDCTLLEICDGEEKRLTINLS